MAHYRLIIITVLLAVLCALTISRSSVYEDEVSLFSDVAAKSPNKARAHNNLGDALNKAHRPEEARPHFERALELQPNYPDALNNLATVYNGMGRRPEALDLYVRALALNPGHLQARFNLAFVYYEQGMLSEAEQHFAILMSIAPESKEGVFARKMLSLIRNRRPS